MKSIIFNTLAYIFHILGRIIREAGRFIRFIGSQIILFGLWIECDIRDKCKNATNKTTETISST